MNTDRRSRRAVLERRLDPELFRALGDERRLALIVRLAAAAEPLTVTEAADCCGVHLSGASRHLAQLRRAGIVESTRAGREVRYRLVWQRLSEALRGLSDAIERCCGSACTGEPR